MLPCLAPELREPLVASLPTHPLLRTSPQGRLLGYLIDHTDPSTYADLARNMNVELATSLPLLYHSISVVLFDAGRSPVFPAKFSLPAILLDGPTPTKLPATYLDLADGFLKFDPPAGACLQFHIVPRGSMDVVFS